MNLMSEFRNRLVTAAVIILALGTAAQEASALSAEQSRGKQIYQRGTSSGGGQIQALVGRDGVALPASAVPCASCHGPDGLGRPEGGIIPPNIRWSELTKVYGHVHEEGRREGRRHPAFDMESLAEVIRTGVDPGGNRLDHSMPMYRMSDTDLADLLAYMKHLESDLDPGLAEDLIRVATLLPLNGTQGKLGQAMAQVMHAHFEEVNRRGGLFGRRLELLVIPTGSTLGTTLDNLRMALQREEIFALVGAYTVGLDKPVLDLLREEEVPLIGPFTLDPGDHIMNTAAFYLYPGFVEQARVLAEASLKEMKGDSAPPVIIGPTAAKVDRLVIAAQEQMQGNNIQPRVLRYASVGMKAEELAAQVADDQSLLFFGAQAELEQLLDALDARQANPDIYLLSSFVPRPLYDAPASFHHKIFLSYPTLGKDITNAGRTEYLALARDHALPPDHLQGQIAAYASAKLLVEGMRRAGRGLNRLALVDSLEALYLYETGLTPPLTYGPNRRIGARGAHLVAVDLLQKNYQQVGGWHEVR